MGIESPKSFNSPDGNIEKPRTLKGYIEGVKTQIEQQDKKINSSTDSGNLIERTLELKDEAERLEAFVDWKGSEVLDQPIGSAIEQFQEFIKEHENEYKEKTGGKEINSLSLVEQADAGDAARASDILGKIVSRMNQFEQGQLYK